jgi:hypothetical protein
VSAELIAVLAALARSLQETVGGCAAGLYLRRSLALGAFDPVTPVRMSRMKSSEE